MRRIAVVGGGITGLAAAWELSGDAGVDVTVLEAGDHFGGKVHTSPFAGRLVDEGADAWLLRVPWATDLVHELGLDADVVAPAARAAYLWSRDALRPFPRRHVLGIPLDLDDLAATGLLSEGELRATRRAYGRPGVPFEGTDTSVADLVAAAAGHPVVDRLVGPLVGGINAGEAGAMSAAALTPQLLAAARHPEGLLGGLRAQLTATDPEAPVFGGFEAGTQRLVDRLVEALGERGVALRRGETVGALPDADGVVLAVPAFAAAPLLAGDSPEAAAALGEVEYASATLVTLAVPAAGIDRPLDASGFLVPRAEGLLLTACSWASTKWAHLAGDPVVLRASTGSAGDDRQADLDDDALVAALLDDLGRTMGLRAEPTEVRVSRWPRSLPQYPVGHLERVTAVDAALARDRPDVVLAGAAYRGVGLPACVHDGRTAARRLADALG